LDRFDLRAQLCDLTKFAREFLDAGDDTALFADWRQTNFHIQELVFL
jgi:hypothetical protein